MESIKVIHETWGEGHVLPTTEQFDDEGNVYVDIMFEHGIEQDVMVDEGLGDFIRGAARFAGRVAAAPGRIKTAAKNFGQSVAGEYQSGKTAHEPKPTTYPLQNKKQAAAKKPAGTAKKRTRVMGEAYDLEEGRGGDEGPEHPVMALRKASTSMSGSHPVTFADGSTHDIPKTVAAKALRKHGSVRSQDKADLERQMGASRSSLMKAIGEEYELDEMRWTGERPTSGTRLLKTYHSENKDGRKAEVRHHPDYGFTVHTYDENGKHEGEDSVFHAGTGESGKEDAHATAAYIMKPMDEAAELSPKQKHLATLGPDNKKEIDAGDLKAAREGKWASKSYKTPDGKWASKDVKEEVEPKISVDTEALRYRAVESSIRAVMEQNLNLRQIALEKKFTGE